ncbi:MAG TPA: hypothetical protein VG815_07485 [Chloroflexota bacterium]|jgi:outer membrane protein assembly factor BamB|nr:hypothetical protein [Chloroflexota bacterium]
MRTAVDTTVMIDAMDAGRPGRQLRTANLFTRLMTVLVAAGLLGFSAAAVPQGSIAGNSVRSAFRASGSVGLITAPRARRVRIGGVVATLTFSKDCPPFGHGFNFRAPQVGIAFDGKYIWFTCGDPSMPTSDSPADLVAANPRTGKTVAEYRISTPNPPADNNSGGLGGLTYDWVHNVLYAGFSDAFDVQCDTIYRIQLNAAHRVVSSRPAFYPDPGFLTDCLDTGLAYDNQTSVIYYADAGSTMIHEYLPTGKLLRSFAWAGRASCPYGIEGLAVGANLIFEGSGSCDRVYVVSKRTLAPVFRFPTDRATNGLHDSGLTCDNETFKTMDVIWSKEAWAPFAYAFKVTRGTCDIRGRPAAPVLSLGATERGRRLVYIIKYRNAGGSTAKAVTVNEVVPIKARVKHVGTLVCASSRHRLWMRFCVGTLNPSQGGTLSFSLRLRPTTPKGAIIKDCVTLSYRDFAGRKHSKPPSCSSIRVRV